MHWNRRVARILVLISVANVALAAPAVRKRHLEMAEAVPEKRALSNSDESPELGPYQSLDDPPPDLPPRPPAPLFHGVPQYLYSSEPSPSWWKYGTKDSASYHDPTPSESSTYNGPASDSPSAASNYDSAHESPSDSSGYKTAPESSAGSFTHSGSVGSTPELVSDSEESANLAEPMFGLEGSASGSGSSQHDAAAGSGPSQHDSASESVSGSESSTGWSSRYPPGPFHEDQDTSLRINHRLAFQGFNWATMSQGSSAPEWSGSSQHDSAAESSAGSMESEALLPALETHTFFNDALKQKLKVSAGVVAVAGVFVGLTLGVGKLIKDHSHKSHPAGRDLASGSVAIRGESMYPTTQKTGFVCLH